MTATRHTDSYYAATARRHEARSALGGNVEADVCVVGGGLAGLTAALELAERGRSVVLLEASRIGFGASGRNGGFVGAGYAQGISVLEKQFGLAAARELHALSREGVAMVSGNVERFAMEGIAREDGILLVLRHDGGDELERAAEHLVRHYGHEVRSLGVDAVRERLKSARYFQGLEDETGFHIHPLNYCLALANACTGAGVRIFEACPALSLERRGAAQEVGTGTGKVRAEHVVLCHSAYGQGLSARLDRAVLPVATYVVASAPDAEALDGAIATRAAVADTRRAGDYYRRLADGRLLWGGRITTQRFEPRALAHMLKRDIVAIYPQLAGLRTDYAWSGLMGYATHKMPIIRMLDPGLWTATAFGGHGLNATAIAGRLVAGAIADEDDRIRLFAPFGARWGGGPAGRAATQAAYWYYQLRDGLDERRAQKRAGHGATRNDG